MGKGVQIAIAAVTVFAGLVWFVATETAGKGTFRYYATVGDFLAEPAPGDTGAQGSRVHGFVADGSIYKDLGQGYVEFVIRDDGQALLPVRYQGIDVPDLFKDGAEVVVEGRYQEGVFLADRMMAKCPSKYEAKEEGPAA